MASLNKTMLIGNVGKDPEIRYLNSNPQGQNTKVGNITLATSSSYTDRNGQRKEETEWHTVITYGKLSDVVEKYIRKGSLLFVDGRLHTRTWEENGKTRYRTEIIANAIQMLNRVEQAGQQQPKAEDYDDIPF